MTPLVIGMVLCLLLLSAGVVAAGSAVLARRNLQSVCDGATNYAAGSTDPDTAARGDTTAAAELVSRYVDQRSPAASAQTGITAEAVTAHCQIEARVTFGSLFFTPTVHLDVDSASKFRRSTD